MSSDSDTSAHQPQAKGETLVPPSTSEHVTSSEGATVGIYKTPYSGWDVPDAVFDASFEAQKRSLEMSRRMQRIPWPTRHGLVG